jgi:hypothetical protein
MLYSEYVLELLYVFINMECVEREKYTQIQVEIPYHWEDLALRTNKF